MNVFQSCSDAKDATPLFVPQKLYLKPVAQLNISVHLPTLKLPGKTIANWEVTEKLRHWAQPEEFTVLKVSKSTLEFIRFEGEIENRSKLPAVLARLDGRYIKLSGFSDPLKVRAAEVRPDFPTRHSWDSYFRDAKNMNEMKPGERPDTIHFLNLPCKWFASKQDPSKPSESILRRVFETFGEIRCIDIPMLDPFRNQMKSHISGVKMFSHNQNMIFEAYVQYKEYFCFVKAMDALRGMKLMQIDQDGKMFSASIKVDFDKTKHLSESSIRRRRIERERLMAKEREKEEEERKTLEREEAKKEAERKKKETEKEAKLERRRMREEKRKVKQLVKLKLQEAEEMNKKIATEERLLLMTQRRLESIRMLGELFNRIKEKKEGELEEKKELEFGRKGQKKSKCKVSKKKDKLLIKEQELKEKLIKKFKLAQEKKSVLQRKKLDDKRDNVLSVQTTEVTLSDSDVPSVKSAKSDLEAKDERGFPGDGEFQHGRGGWYGKGRGMLYARGGHFSQFHNRGGYYPRRRGYRWPRFPPRGRGGFFPPFIDPLFLDINQQYYKYFKKLDQRKSYSRSRSRSRSRSHDRRRRSRSYTRSRSRSRSYTRSRSRSYSRSRSRKSSRRRSRSRTRSRNRPRQKSVERVVVENDVEKPVETVQEKQPSIEHTWSRSPSRSRSISWEKKKEEEKSPRKHKHKKDKKKKKKGKKIKSG